MRVLGVDVPGKHVGGYAVLESEGEQLLHYGKIKFEQALGERHTYSLLWDQLAKLQQQYRFTVVGIEHPFLHLIAQHIGAIKMWVARRSGVSWYMLTASSARKAVFGDAKKITRINKQGREVNAVKEFVLTEIAKKYDLALCSQHEADAILYAIAVARLVRVPEPVHAE